MSEPKAFNSLIEAILYRKEKNPDGRVFVFLDENDQSREVTNEQFYDDMQRYARGLIAQGIRPGEIVLLALDHDYELLCCFWGAICCGAIPSVLTYWRSGSSVDTYTGKVKILAEAVCARAVITMPDLYSATSAALEQIKCLVFKTEEIAVGSSGMSLVLPKLKPEQIALMQFTSGTTSEPRAVRFSHRMVLDHVAASAEAYRMTGESITVSWLPFYHDMGLIGHIRALIHGKMLVSMAPQAWLRRPEMLFHAISRYRGTITNMPNFGFDYCVQRIRDENITGVDLNSWKRLSNGSEPVNFISMQLFFKKFAAYGFEYNALAVAYGMAENVMGISVTPPEQKIRADWVATEELYSKKKAVTVQADSTGAQAIVSCGYPYRNIELAIVDDNWRKLGEREVGEIAINSKTLFTGYYLSPEDKEGRFREGFFRTGDIGYLFDGQLYVCGRKKDLIISGGRNIQPQAIENIAADVFGPFAGRCVAFGVSDQNLGTELPVLIVEERKQLEDAEKQNLINQVRKRVSDELEVAISGVHLVPKGWVIKTTSGKIARASNRAKYLQEYHDNKNQEPKLCLDELSPERIEQILTDMFEKVLGASQVDRKEDFLNLGGDSLSALRLLLEIEQRFGREISAADFFQQPTVEHIALVLQRQSAEYANAKTKNLLMLKFENLLATKPVTQMSNIGKIREKIIRYSGIQLIANIIYKLKLTYLTWIYGKKWVQKMFYAEQAGLIRQFYKLIEDPAQTEEEVVQCGLVLNHSENIRIQLSDQIISKKEGYWSLNVDEGPLRRAYQAGKGLIIAGTHISSPLVHLLHKLVLERLSPCASIFVRGIPNFLIENAKSLPAKERRCLRVPILLDQLMKSKSVLKQGGIVLILPDGGGGISRNISFPFHGRFRGFRTGFAELAAETDSGVIFVSLSVDVCKKQVKASFIDPLGSGPADKSHSERVAELVRLYAEFLKKGWACYPGNVPLRQMRKHILNHYG